MEVITTIADLRRRLRDERQVACVPTMGNIHAGHLRLVAEAHDHAPCVVTTVFVNPLQFNQPADFTSYPRTFEDDCAKLEAAGVHVVFHPTEGQIYPEAQVFIVEPPPIANKLEGRFRPGHFRGMTTVVLKLLNIVQPQVAVFGKKDFQQLHIVRHMVQQLALPVQIVAVETLRAPDGLALSSRNRFLSAEQRLEATRLYRALSDLKAAIEAGDRNFAAMEFAADASLARYGWQVDYVALRRPLTLTAPEPGDREFVGLGAARLGETRLIDNMEIFAAQPVGNP